MFKSLHIENGCPGPKKLRTNLCLVKGCGQKSLAMCRDCGGRCCAKHRFSTDHACSGAPVQLSRSGATLSKPSASRFSSTAVDGRPLDIQTVRQAVSVACPVCGCDVNGISSTMSAVQVNRVVMTHIEAGCPTPTPKKAYGIFKWLTG